MSDTIGKITKILLWVLIALSLFYALMLFINTTVEDTKWVSNALAFMYVILILAAGAVVLFSLINFFLRLTAQPKKALLSLIPIVILAIIVFLTYSNSSSEILDMPNYEGEDNTPTNVQWGGAGLLTTYILLGLAVLSILYAEVARLFK